MDSGSSVPPRLGCPGSTFALTKSDSGSSQRKPWSDTDVLPIALEDAVVCVAEAPGALVVAGEHDVPADLDPLGQHDLVAPVVVAAVVRDVEPVVTQVRVDGAHLGLLAVLGLGHGGSPGISSPWSVSHWLTTLITVACQTPTSAPSGPKRAA